MQREAKLHHTQIGSEVGATRAQQIAEHLADLARQLLQVPHGKPLKRFGGREFRQ
jgi:hypothetical protein